MNERRNVDEPKMIYLDYRAPRDFQLKFRAVYNISQIKTTDKFVETMILVFKKYNPNKNNPAIKRGLKAGKDTRSYRMILSQDTFSKLMDIRYEYRFKNWYEVFYNLLYFYVVDRNIPLKLD